MVKQIFRRSHSPIFITLALAFALAGPLNISRSARVQEPSTTQAANRIELHQALLDLTNPWTVMCIAAHPDDEDGTSLIVMRRKYGAHTVSLFSTFGEGGQNAIGPELYEELGAIRARETMAAAEIQGSEPYFLGLKDFGYSKSADEAFRVWGHDEALRRMVLQIRKLRPDVIITNHSATNNDHGHHQATARLELEAFDAAADPKRFPEQLKDDVSVWQVQRLFVRAGRSNQTQPDTAPIVTIDPNELDAVRGKIYAAEALEGLQKHATQGPWPKTVAQMAARFANSSDGRLPLIRYRLTRDAKGAEPLRADSHYIFDGLHLPAIGTARLGKLALPSSSPVDSDVEQQRTFKLLAAFLKTGGFTPDSDRDDVPRLARMTERLNIALAATGGIGISLTAEQSVVTPGSSTNLSITVANHSMTRVRVYGEVVSWLNPGASRKFSRPEKIKDKWTFSADPLMRDRNRDLQISVTYRVEIKGVIFPISAAIHLTVVPPVEIESMTPSPYVFTPANLNRALGFRIRLANHLGKPFKGAFGIGSDTEHTHEVGTDIALGPNETREFTFSTNVIPVDTPDEKRTPRADFGSLIFSVHASGSVNAITQTETHVVYADARVSPELRVGYVRGFDYSLPNALAALGVESKELSVDEVKTADLQKYSTIIVDNRVYESQPGLIAANQKLLDFAKDGGTLIVFYHKSFEWNPDERRNRPQLAPYKLILGDERITDETAPITFLEPEHPLLNFPNKIGQEDFANWIQERGLYYPKNWDPQFHALLQANDPGEAPLKGGLLVADYGRGHYIYTSMVWYRELRAGVPGAYRMFANMISYGHK